jgi:type IV pilus assembly protein PilV
MLTTRAARDRQAGTTMLEVLVTLVILAFGMLGLAGLHIKIQTLDMEAYQRAQAILLLRDTVERIKANSANAADYVPASASTMYGSGYTATCPGSTQAEKDICEWSNALQGASESSSGTKVGAMIGARGCIQQITAPDPTPGICQPGTYRVSVAWQGLFATSAPALSCGSGQYGLNEAVRRAISSDIVIGLPSCI